MSRYEPLTVITGRLTGVGEQHIVVEPGSRVILPPEFRTKLAVGQHVTVRAVRRGARFVAETILVT